MVRLRAIHAGLLRHRSDLSLRSSAHAEVAAVQSSTFRQHAAGFGVEYRGELPHQYELAVLFRREHDELISHRWRDWRGTISFRRRSASPLRLPSFGASCGRRQRRSGTSGSTSLAARSTFCCRSRSSSGSSWWPKAFRKTFMRIRASSRSKGSPNRSPVARWPRKKSSKNSGRTAAASLTRIPRRPTRIPTP